MYLLSLQGVYNKCSFYLYIIVSYVFQSRARTQKALCVCARRRAASHLRLLPEELREQSSAEDAYAEVSTYVRSEKEMSNLLFAGWIF